MKPLKKKKEHNFHHKTSITDLTTPAIHWALHLCKYITSLPCLKQTQKLHHP